jgi:hypothetical protein
MFFRCHLLRASPSLASNAAPTDSTSLLIQNCFWFLRATISLPPAVF